MSSDRPTYIKGENTEKYESCLFKNKQYKIKLKYVRAMNGSIYESDETDGPWTECEIIDVR